MVVPEGNLPAAAVRCGVVAECQNQKHSSTAPMLLRLLRRLLRRLLLLLLLPLRLLRGNHPKQAPRVGTERAGYARISTGTSMTISKTQQGQKSEFRGRRNAGL